MPGEAQSLPKRFSAIGWSGISAITASSRFAFFAVAKCAEHDGRAGTKLEMAWRGIEFAYGGRPYTNRLR